MLGLHSRPLYTRLYGLAFLGFIFGIIYGMLSLALPIMAEDIFLSLAFIGVVFALPEILGMFIDIPIGAFSHHFGRRRMIFYSGVLLAVVALLFLSAQSALLFIGLLCLYEFATQSYVVPANAELMALSPRRRTGRFNAVSEGLHNFGFSLGPAVGGFLLAYGVDYLLYSVLALALLMVVAAHFVLPRERVRVEGLYRSLRDTISRDHVFASSFSEFKAMGWGGWYAAGLLFFYALHWGFIAVIEPLFGVFLNLDTRFIGLIYAGFSLPYIFTTIVAGRYADKHGFKKITILGLLLIAVSSIGFGLSGDPKILFLFSVVAGVGDALILIASMAIFDLLSALHSKERVAGVEVFSESTGYFVGPLFAGLGAALLGFQPIFIILGFCTLLLFVVGIIVPHPTGSR